MSSSAAALTSAGARRGALAPALALAAAVPVAVALRALLGTGFAGELLSGGAPALLSFLLLQPLLEELAFRGLLQGGLRRAAWGRRALLGVSAANAVCSLAFAALHLVHHSPAWAAAVVAPSLVLGWSRDRTGSVLPALALHVAYNATYLAAGA